MDRQGSFGGRPSLLSHDKYTLCIFFQHVLVFGMLLLVSMILESIYLMSSIGGDLFIHIRVSSLIPQMFY